MVFAENQAAEGIDVQHSPCMRSSGAGDDNALVNHVAPGHSLFVQGQKLVTDNQVDPMVKPLQDRAGQLDAVDGPTGVLGKVGCGQIHPRSLRRGMHVNADPDHDIQETGSDFVV